MPLPGWNVSEPIQLAFKLYEVVDALKSAPEDAKAFVSKVDGFRRNLEMLQEMIKDNIGDHYSPQVLDTLGLTLAECQDCVKRCEDLSRSFNDLTKADKGSFKATGQRVRLMWQEKKVTKLAAEIDSQVSNISLTLAISQDSRSRRGSMIASPGFGLDAPRRASTISSLPPYPAPLSRLSWGQDEQSQQGKTPSDMLDLKTHHQESRFSTEMMLGRSNPLLESDNGVREISYSPDMSPYTLRPENGLGKLPEWDKDTLRPFEGTETEVVVESPESSRTSSSPSTGPSSCSPNPSPETSKQGAQRLSGDAMLEDVVDNLNGVKVSYFNKNSRTSYSITKIESWRNIQTGRRCIILERPSGSNVQFVCFPRNERIVPHSEHPAAYGPSNDFKIKFIEPWPLYSQKNSSPRRSSDGSMMALAPSTTTSASASMRSHSDTSSPVPGVKELNLQEEARRYEYNFEKEQAQDYRKFQELLMGEDVKLQAQLPIQHVTSKRYDESKPLRQSELQNLRLWQFGRHQYLMFFCNVTSGRHKEYKMEYFRPAESKSKSTVKLDVHLPGMVRRGSKSKRPILIAEHSAHSHSSVAGLTANTDIEDLKSLDHLTVEFSSAEGKIAFLQEAKFHNLQDDAVIAPSSQQSCFPTA